MKNLIALIAIAALAAISCAPEVDVSSYDWSGNQQYDVDLGNSITVNNIWPDALTYVDHVTSITTGTPSVTTYTNLQFSLTFGSTADFLRADDVGAELAKFLSFYRVNRSNKLDAAGTAIETAAVSNAPEAGTLDTLSAPIAYEFVKRTGSTVTVRLTGATYSSQDDAATVELSNRTKKSQIIAKIDGTAFTYARGLKVDLDNNGIPGEEFYDDRWLTGTGVTTYGGVQYNNVALKQNLNWSFTIANLSALDGTLTFTGPNTFTAATLSATGSSVKQANAIRSAFAGSFKLQKFVSGNWTDASTAVYTPDATDADLNPGVIQFKDVTIEHLAPYRIVWKGSEDPTYATEFRGVKQRISINGTETITPTPSSKYLRNQTQRNGAYHVFVDGTKADFIHPDETTFDITPYSYSSDFKNVVLELEVGIIDVPRVDAQGDPVNDPTTSQQIIDYYGLKEITSLATFKESFRIIYQKDGNNHKTVTVANVPSLTDFIEVDIIDVKFAKSPAATSKGVNDLIRITLDPNYKLNTSSGNTAVLINNGLSYTDGKSVFGNPSGIAPFKGFFNAYIFGNF